MKRASLLGFIGVSLLIVGGLFDLLYFYFFVNEVGIPFEGGIVIDVIANAVALLFPISFMYVLYKIKNSYK